MTKKFEKNSNGVYEDSINSVVKEGTYFNDAAIIPMVQYQVYGLDNVWFWDNEGLNYTYDGTPSVISVVPNTTTYNYYIVKSTNIPTYYYGVGEYSWGEGVSEIPDSGTSSGTKDDSVLKKENVGKYYAETIDGNTKYYPVEGTYSFISTTVKPEAKIESTEKPESASLATLGKWYAVNVTVKYLDEYTPANATEADSITNTVPDNIDSAAVDTKYREAVVYTNYEFNKYGVVPTNTQVKVNITPNTTLIAKYPGAIVTIDGKEYDLAKLATITATTNEGVTTYSATPKDLVLNMNKNHTISINWVWGSVVETFRIICNQ